jgi:hypothetical protein
MTTTLTRVSLALALALLTLGGCLCAGPTPDEPGGAEAVGATVVLHKVGDGTGIDGRGTVESDPAGIDCDDNCVDDGATPAATFAFPPEVTEVTLTAEAERTALFESWTCQSALAGGALGDTVTETALEFVVLDNPEPTGVIVECTATFKQLRTIQIIFSGQGTGTVVGSAPSAAGGTRIDCPSDIAAPNRKCTAGYFHGEAETLTATADPGSVFVGWQLPECPGNGNLAELTMNADVDCEARFDPQ